MAELVDACASQAHAERRVGSSPTSGTAPPLISAVIGIIFCLLARRTDRVTDPRPTANAAVGFCVLKGGMLHQDGAGAGRPVERNRRSSRERKASAVSMIQLQLWL
jgi:hypothetical protein